MSSCSGLGCWRIGAPGPREGLPPWLAKEQKREYSGTCRAGGSGSAQKQPGHVIIIAEGRAVGIGQAHRPGAIANTKMPESVL